MICSSDCPLCRGKGWVDVDGGGLAVCPNTPLDYRGTGVTSADKDVPRLLKNNKNLSQIGSALKELRKTGYGLLWLQGSFGVGKTVLAKAATAEVFQSGKSALYVRQLEMINNLRAAFADEKGQAIVLQRKAAILAVRWLVIDEIGRVNQTPFSDETMGEIVDSRYQQALRQESMTVLISNDNPDEVLSDYLVDRIRDVKNKMLVIEGKSLREG